MIPSPGNVWFRMPPSDRVRVAVRFVYDKEVIAEAGGRIKVIRGVRIEEMFRAKPGLFQSELHAYGRNQGLI